MNHTIKAVLLELQKQSSLEKSRRVDVPSKDRMLAITEDTGKFYHILLKNSKASQVLEIGTSVGYSTLWFVSALIENYPKNSKLITIEENPSKIKRAKKNFEKARVLDHIEIRKGKALQVLKKLGSKKNQTKIKFDFVYIDADKENIINYFELALPLIRLGGIIAADNMLYPTKYRTYMKKYSKYISAKNNVETITIPLGNGQEISIKTSD